MNGDVKSRIPTRQLSSSGKVGKARASEGQGLSTGALFLIAVMLTLATFMFPDNEMTTIEQKAEHIAQKAESDILNWVHSGSNGASSKMLKQDSKWVDGEKKLKLKLKELAKRQAQGLDIGVPVLTRYLGEDIPAWPDGTISKEDWEAKVKAKYAEMRKEEDEWRAKVGAILKTKYGA